VFVCTANTARSHLAAALSRQASDAAAASACPLPGTEINPRARAAAERHGIMLPNTKPRSLDLQRRSRDLIITVCDKELGDQGWAYWSIPDPVTQAPTAPSTR
jgi:protein-tyrosine-phosphatase